MGRVGVSLLVALLMCGCGRARVATIQRVAPEADVSNARGTQSEVSVAVSVDGKTLLAGSNEGYAYSERAYSSVDGGRSWVSRLDPPLPHPDTACAFDPAVAIDSRGRQYYAFIEDNPCGGKNERLSLYIATRPWAGGVWLTRPHPIALAGYDDHPAIAVDRSPRSAHAGRVYLAWARETSSVSGIVVVHSDDAGRTWSPPKTVNDTGANAYDVTLAIGPTGIVYVAWLDLEGGLILVDHSADGGDTFGTDYFAAQAHGFFNSPSCGVTGIKVRAQNARCVRPSATVSVDTSNGEFSGRVYVTYSDVTANGGNDVFVTAFDAKLSPLFGYPLGLQHRVTAPETAATRSDQFMPVSATDPASGALWICFYDTLGDVSRYSTRFSCVASRDGGQTFSAAMRAATAWSDETSQGTDSDQYGDYQGLAVGAGEAHPLWTDSRQLYSRGEEIFTTTLRLGSRP